MLGRRMKLAVEELGLGRVTALPIVPEASHRRALRGAGPLVNRTGHRT
jgi:hypothetical protein